jgi:hypothetical protein
MKKTYRTGSCFHSSSDYNESLRMLPRHGTPRYHIEWVSQKIVKTVAFFPIYALLIVVLTVVASIWIIPSIEGLL